MHKTYFASLLAVSALATSAHAISVNFTYTQSDATTGSGSIAPFTFMGHNFTATPLPSAIVVNPSLEAGFVGAQTVQSGSGNEPNSAIGLRFSGTVTAMSDDGFTIQIPLRFVPKETQAPDINDYTWNVLYGDSPAVDAIGSGLRFAMWFSRDVVIDATDTPNTFQRYTQNNQTFVAGAETFSNTDTTTADIKDATDSAAPSGDDAAGQDLAFYFGWRDQGALTGGAILVDNFAIGGLLNPDETTLVPVGTSVPEAGPGLIAFGLVMLGICVLKRHVSASQNG